MDIAAIAEDAVCAAGLLLLAVWLAKTSLGRKALADAAPRRNNMPAYLPFIPLLSWFIALSLTMLLMRKIAGAREEWKIALLDNFVVCIVAAGEIAVIVFLAGISFAGRLKGFGLNIKTIGRDFLAGAVNLLAVWPLVTLMLVLTILVGQLIEGTDFQLPQHEELKLITQYPQISVRTVIIVAAVVIVPVFEEMLFRGLFQTMIRSFLETLYLNPGTSGRNGAWLSIAITSAIFAAVHQNPEHWPALFVLSMCLGYAYEKSGSLLRPIFIHSFFNAASIIGALYSG